MLSRVFFKTNIGIALVFILCLSVSWSHAQSYNFTKFNLKEGLPQSQVVAIYQAKDRTLWMGTYGGLSNFDGKEFNSLSKADGLIANAVTAIIEDNNGQLIVGTNAGISIVKNGKVLRSISQYPITTLKKDKQGIIWGISSNRLFKIVDRKVVFIDVERRRVTSLNENAGGDLFLVASGKGIFRLVRNNWVPVIAFDQTIAKEFIFTFVFDRVDQQKIYLLSAFKGVFVYDGSVFKPLFDSKSQRYNALIQDYKGNLWVGAQDGAYLIKKNGVIHFNARNGLADDPVFEVFSDAENNIWISSSSNGIFKYEGDSFVKFDKLKSQNLEYPISCINTDKNNNLFIGTFNRGLLKYNGTELEAIQNPAFKDRNIYFLYKDDEKNIWFSVHDSGIWKTDGKHFSLIHKVERYNFNLMLKDKEGVTWICNPVQCTYNYKGEKRELRGFSGYTSCLFELDKGNILLGTTTGLYLIKDRKLDRSFEIKELRGACILSIVRHNDYLLIGTLGDGMISWNLKTKEIKKYTTADGLYSNDVYSLEIDQNQKLWIGTGRGINKLFFNKSKNRYEVFSKNSIIVECNQAAILNYKGNILIGTITGLVQCKTNEAQEQTQSPLVHLSRVNIYHKTDNSKDQSIYLTGDAKKTYEFGYNQSHISINYKAVFLTNPYAVTYRYKLVGLDVDYGKAIKNTQVEYSALRPGKYTFYVYAIANGQKSNVSQFDFTIVPPFYDTVWFRVLAIVGLVLLIWLISYSFFKSKERKKLELEKIKVNEQNKIRKQTSEDFHDDIGNKLTRINVLSEILDKKMDKDQLEQKELIRLIKENAGLLYTGTKDILWALNPQSNNLFEILVHIKDFGTDLFQNTGIKFEMEGILSDYHKIHLPMEFNRNFTLIFKEILNNVLKHAKAEEVLIMVVKTPEDTIDVFTVDNGIGFDAKNIIKGSGLQNIQTRCKRIKAGFKINSTPGKGTTSIISTKITVTN